MCGAHDLWRHILWRHLVQAAAAGLIATTLAPASFGVIVDIRYYDQGVLNPEFAGGPLWTGFVDTQANSLTIETWTELPLHGNEFWMPRELPLVWQAYDSAGGFFDVPETFDGRIGDFAFISNLPLQQMPWYKPVFAGSPPTLVDKIPVEYTNFTGDVYPGWGGYAYQELNARGEVVVTYATSNPDHATDPANEPDYDERIMPALPVLKPGASFPTYTWSDDATITAGRGANPVAVPEMSGWVLASAALVVSAGFSLLRARSSRAA